MFISLRKAVSYRSMRFYRRRGGGIWHRQQAAGRARNTVHRIVRVVRVRATSLHVRAGIAAGRPFCQRGKCEKQLSGHQQTNRRKAECSWKNARAIKAHHDRSVVAFTPEGQLSGEVGAEDLTPNQHVSTRLCRFYDVARHEPILFDDRDSTLSGDIDLRSLTQDSEYHFLNRVFLYSSGL